MSVTPSIKFEFRLPFDINQDGKWFIASCDILDVHSQGTTEKKALENLKEALKMFIESCFDRGTLDEVLKECGFSMTNRPIARESSERILDLPISLVGPEINAPSYSH